MIRFNDRDRVVELSVRDLVDSGPMRGDLRLGVVQSLAARAAAGRRVHSEWQEERKREDDSYQAEVTVRTQIAVDAWTVKLHGRVDGLTREEPYLVVEEVKSTTLPSHRLYGLGPEDVPRWTQQLELYLWMLASPGEDPPIGRLVLVSLADGSHHVMGVRVNREDVRKRAIERLQGLIRRREARIAWMARRRIRPVPDPHDTWRPGQQSIAEATQWGMESKQPILIEAPTGLGKTDAVLVGALRYALANDKQVFWATSRTTQQAAPEAALGRLAAAGLSVRTVTLSAREKVCLNDAVVCTPDACDYALGYHDKIRDSGVLQRLVSPERHVDRASLCEAGQSCSACPFEMGLQLSEQADLVIGDLNYAFDPSVSLGRHFSDTASDWVVVVDEAHQLVDRARSWGSPQISAKEAREAAQILGSWSDAFVPFAEIASAVADAVFQAVHSPQFSGSRADEGLLDAPPEWLMDLARRVDDVALEYALLRAELPPPAGGEMRPDPWSPLARSLIRFRQASESMGEETVCIGCSTPGQETVGLLCLDPSVHLGPRIERLGGFVGCSATLSPVEFYRDLMGLDREKLENVRVGSFFPSENRRVIVAPRVSTLFRDRQSHAPRTAKLLQQCICAVPGNTAVYFPSFAMLNDIVERWDLPDHDILVQRSSMEDQERAAWLARLSAEGRPVVLAAVLGGIFAEGIDLPAGALSGVLVAGPALPPIGLERDLLRECYEQRYGQGFRYASLVPGLTRVIQAAGRLIRRSEDRGVVVLVGQRFRWRDIRSLLPDTWAPVTPTDPVAEIRAFFGETP